VQNKPYRLGPVAISSGVANVCNPGTSTGGVNSPAVNLRIILTHMRIVNKTAGAVTITMYIGATGGSAAGTEFAWNGTSVPANSALDWYGRVPLEVADYLTASAGAGTSLTLTAEGEIGLT
jgi:hypothetical protein